MTSVPTAITDAGARWSYLWLAIGLGLTLFGTGKWVIGFAAWLGWAFLLRWMRTQRPLRGYLILVLPFAAVFTAAWWDVLPFPLVLYVMPAQAVVSSLPLLFDRLMVSKLPALAGTLVFPLSAVAIEFVATTASPLGSFGAVGYSQFALPGLTQLASVTGLWGIALLVYWFAAVVNLAWERGFSWPACRRPVAALGVVVAVVLAAGNTRLLFALPASGTVRIAGITAAEIRMNELSPLRRTDPAAFRAVTGQIHQRYLDATVREARAGARIVVWSEGAGIGFDEDEAALVDAAETVARAEGIYLACRCSPTTMTAAPRRTRCFWSTRRGPLCCST